MRARPRVLAIQHAAEEPSGLVAEVLAAAGAALEVVRADRGDAVPRDAAGLGGLVVMGGPMGVGDLPRLAHLRDEHALVASALSRDVPVLGICLGSQLVASALGGRVEAASRKEIGWHPVTLEPAARQDPLFGDLPSSFVALHWHGDVFALPRGAAALARSEATPLQAFRHGRAWGILFHAEIGSAQLEGMARAFEEELEAADVSADALLHGERRHGPALARVGRSLYGAWARIVAGG